jgi:hypothetical protein
VNAPHYRRTQIGWPIPISVAALVGIAMFASDGGFSLNAFGIGAMFIVGAFLMFTLTIVVDAAAIHVSVGLAKRRIALRDVRGWREVRSPLHHGIGARLIPGGWLYCVKSGSAIELLLENGRIVRVGTPEPKQLMTALAHLRTPPVPDYADVAVTVRKGWWPF